MKRIYADRSFLSTETRPIVMLYPFWGAPPEDPRNPSTGRYDDYVARGSELFEETDLASADFVILPVPWEDVRTNEPLLRAIEMAVEKARQAAKPLVVFFWSDSDDDVPIPDAYVFRTSFYRSTRTPREFALPAWSEDLVARYLGGELSWREKAEQPVVGFCGWAGPTGSVGQGGPLRTSTSQRVRQRLSRAKARIGMTNYDDTRGRALRLLAERPLVRTNFVLRDRYLGGPVILNESSDERVALQLRREFVQNLVDSDYVLCVRGSGNYSYRLYEALSCGRIPILVNTDCVLPYDFMIDWREYCVWIEADEVDQIAQKVAEFHRRLTPAEFVARQQACRRLWEELISPTGFFRNFHRHFDDAPVEDEVAGVPVTAGQGSR